MALARQFPTNHGPPSVSNNSYNPIFGPYGVGIWACRADGWLAAGWLVCKITLPNEYPCVSEESYGDPYIKVFDIFRAGRPQRGQNPHFSYFFTVLRVQDHVQGLLQALRFNFPSKNADLDAYVSSYATFRRFGS